MHLHSGRRQPVMTLRQLFDYITSTDLVVHTYIRLIDTYIHTYIVIRDIKFTRACDLHMLLSVSVVKSVYTNNP